MANVAKKIKTLKGKLLQASIRTWVVLAIFLVGTGMLLGGVLADSGSQKSGSTHIADCNHIVGWAKDYGPFDSRVGDSTRVRLYDNATGALIAEGDANLFDQFISDLGFPGNHGFDLPIPPAFRDGLVHTFYIQVMDLTDGDYVTVDPYQYAAQIYAYGRTIDLEFGPCGAPVPTFNYDPFTNPTGSVNVVKTGAVQLQNIDYYVRNVAATATAGPTYELRLEQQVNSAGPWSTVANAGTLPGLPGNGTATALPYPAWTFDIQAAAPGRYCFRSVVTPSSNNLDEVSSQYCITISSPTTPFIQTNGSDVHAGNCAVPGAPAGDIRVSSGLLGEYVISSLNSTSTSTPLSISNYGPICRPDLVATALVTPNSAFTSIGAMANGGIYRINSGNLPGGNATTRSTIFSTGNLTISGPITSSGQASLGIIVDGDVYINRNVTRIDAFIYASGTIYTCDAIISNLASAPNGPNATNVPLCKSPLVINGFLSGGNFLFGRTGGSVGGVPSENIQFDASLYTLVPPLFNRISNSGYPSSFTELAPRY